MSDFPEEYRPLLAAWREHVDDVSAFHPPGPGELAHPTVVGTADPVGPRRWVYLTGYWVGLVRFVGPKQLNFGQAVELGTMFSPSCQVHVRSWGGGSATETRIQSDEVTAERLAGAIGAQARLVGLLPQAYPAGQVVPR